MHWLHLISKLSDLFLQIYNILILNQTRHSQIWFCWPSVLSLNTTLQNSTGKLGLLYCTNDVIFKTQTTFINPHNIFGPCSLQCSFSWYTFHSLSLLNLCFSYKVGAHQAVCSAEQCTTHYKWIFTRNCDHLANNAVSPRSLLAVAISSARV